MSSRDSAPELVQFVAGLLDFSAGNVIAVSNGILKRVHDPSDCAEQSWGCWVHRPLPHALSDAPVLWREERGGADRVCAHGEPHPDPQDAAYWWHIHGRDITLHDCDGCCRPFPAWAR